MRPARGTLEPVEVLEDGDADLWLLSTVEAPRRGVCLSCCLSADERLRAGTLAHPERRREWVLSRGLLRHALSRYALVAPADWRFAVDPRGRPHVAHPRTRPPLHFSASHTQGLVCCLVSREPAIGVDVEPLDREIPILALAQRHFTREEAEELRALPEVLRREAFLERWTLSEALLKACGIGLTTRLDDFRFVRDPGHGRPRVAFAQRPGRRGMHVSSWTEWRWQLETLRLETRHSAALALRLRGAERFRVSLRRARGEAGPCPLCGATGAPGRTAGAGTSRPASSSTAARRS